MLYTLYFHDLIQLATSRGIKASQVELVKNKRDELVSPQTDMILPALILKWQTVFFILNVLKSLNIQTVCGENTDKRRADI